MRCELSASSKEDFKVHYNKTNYSYVEAQIIIDDIMFKVLLIDQVVILLAVVFDVSRKAEQFKDDAQCNVLLSSLLHRYC